MQRYVRWWREGFAGLLIGAPRGVNKETLLSPGYCPVEGLWERDPLAEKIARVAAGSFQDRNPPDIKGTGTVATNSCLRGSRTADVIYLELDDVLAIACEVLGLHSWTAPSESRCWPLFSS